MQQTASNPAPDTSLFEDGFLALRAGIFDHLNQSCFTPNSWMVYCILLRQCDWSTGLWNGNTYRIQFALGKVLSIPQIQRAIRGLEKKKYVRSYHKKGHRGNYFVAIHKYRVAVGNLRGKYLNALKSESYRSPVYEERCDKDVIATSDVSDAHQWRISGESDPSLYQDVKDVQESEKATPSTIAKTVDGAVDALSSKDKGADKEQSEPTLTDRDDFLIIQRQTWDDNATIHYKATRAHENAAYEASQQYGLHRYMSALVYWLDEEADRDTILKTDQESGRLIRMSWPLDFFLKNRLAFCMEKAASLFDAQMTGTNPECLLSTSGQTTEG